MKKPFGGTSQQIEGLGNKLRNSILRKRSDPKEDTGDWLRWHLNKLGGRYKNVDRISCDFVDRGLITIWNPDNLEVRFSNVDTFMGDNWSLAVALGHYYLHYDRKDPKEALFFVNEREPFGWQAHWFAAALTMPRDFVVEQIRKNWKRDVMYYATMGVAGHFEITHQAAKMRVRCIYDELLAEQDEFMGGCTTC